MGGQSIFDEITNEDLIMAFFPCTRFEDQVMLSFRGENCGMQKRWNTIQKLENSMRLHDELNEFYKLISMLVIVAEKRNLRMVIENPYSAQHYLKQYWCIKPSIVDKDRTLRGDFYGKPTQYFFINFEPYHNLVFEPLKYVEREKLKFIKTKDGLSRQTLRSMIHPQYASRFIKEFLIEYQTDIKQIFGFNPYQE